MSVELLERVRSKPSPYRPWWQPWECSLSPAPGHPSPLQHGQMDTSRQMATGIPAAAAHTGGLETHRVSGWSEAPAAMGWSSWWLEKSFLLIPC